MLTRSSKRIFNAIRYTGNRHLEINNSVQTEIYAHVFMDANPISFTHCPCGE